MNKLNKILELLKAIEDKIEEKIKIYVLPSSFAYTFFHDESGRLEVYHQGHEIISLKNFDEAIAKLEEFYNNI